MGVEGGEYVVASFGEGYAMKAVRHTMGAPRNHNSTSKLPSAVFGVVFPTAALLLDTFFSVLTLFQLRVRRSITKLGSRIEATRLNEL